MKDENDLPELKVFGSTTVGPKGQMVIPANARKEVNRDTGTTLLVFKAFHGQGLILLQADAIEQMMSMVSRQLAGFEKLVEGFKLPEAVKSKEGVD